MLFGGFTRINKHPYMPICILHVKMNMKKMIHKFRWIWIMAPIAVLFLGFCSSKTKKGENLLPKIVIQELSKSHYRPIEVNDSFSVRVFELFLKRLDRNKRFFLASDYKDFLQYQYALDDQAKEGSFEFFDLVNNRFMERVEQVANMYEEILSEGFNFNVKEYYNVDEEERNYPEHLEALREDWRKFLKLNVLERYHNKRKSAESSDSAKASVSDDNLQVMLKESIEEVLKIQKNWFKRLQKFDRDKQLDFYINCIAEAYDPHTSYFPPREKEDFDIRMSGRLEGIGAQLSERDGEIKVEMIVPGSPSYIQGDLKEGDIIIKVAQKDSTPVSVVNMDLSDAVSLIRGKKGTTVILTVRKPDGKIMDISIVRDIVIMEEGYAKSAILKEGKQHIGFIHLPQFYTDMSNRGGRTCSKDVKKEVQKLMDEGIDGLVIDLRNNGGGSLSDVVDMAGLFIGKRPVVMAKYRDQRPDILGSREKDILYKGPLIILVNKYSASASEILAAALQDYDRALIVGTNDQTFGKGTVQRFQDLDRYSPSSGYSFGSLKVTIQKFYRVNGGTTQLKGVVPDVVLPERFSSIIVGERSEDFPLQWNEIEPLKIKMDMPGQRKKIKAAAKKSAGRIAKSDIFQVIQSESDRIAKDRKNNTYPLQYEAYKKREEERSAILKSYEKKLETIQSDTLQVLPLQKDLDELGGDEVRLKIKQDWLKNYRSDIYLKEAVRIMADL
jgi:carboxyl-terminal processing protease